MTLFEIKNVISAILRTQGLIKEISLEDFNNYLQLANYDYLKKKYGFPKDIDGAETNQQISDSLLPFKKVTTVALTTGTGTLPVDYLHLLATTVTSAVTRVDILTELEFEERNDNSIIAPTTNHPVLVLRDGEVEVRPTSVASIDIVYIKMPVTPSLAVTITNGVLVNDAGSTVELEWGAEHHVDIIRQLLEYLGLSMGRQDVIAYSENKEIQEN